MRHISLDSSIINILFGTQYIFRGVSNANYELIPSARRGDVDLNSLSFPSEADQFNSETLIGQIAKEYLILKRFYEFADNAGLKLPDAPRLRRSIRNKIGSSAALDHWRVWPSEEIEPICALAQHYGLPTCMIDWTYSFNIALYFAVIGLVSNLQNHTGSDEKFSIYILNTRVLDELKLRVVAKWPIEIIQPAYYDNPNLSAQKGLLSFWRDNIPEYTRNVVCENRHTHTAIARASDCQEERFNEIPLNKKYAEFVTKLRLDGEFLERAHSLFYKVTYSYSCLEKALLHLSTTKTNRSTLFPGFSGVVQYMRDNGMIRKKIIYWAPTHNLVQ